MRAAGGKPRGVATKVRVPLDPATHTDAAAALVLRRLAKVAEANVAGAVEDLDPEFLHDLRVSIRRARAVLRELRGVLEPRERARLRDELKWAQALTGPVRDLDVQLLEWPELTGGLDGERGAELEPLRALLERRRARERAKLVRGLRSARFAGLLAAWRALADGQPRRRRGGTPRAALPIERTAGGRIVKVYRRMVRDGRAIGEDSPPEALHELRKRGKELRYLLELFGGAFEDESVEETIKALKGLQTVLGRYQDRAVQIESLRGLRDDLAGEPDGPAALIALGPVLDLLAADQAAARDEFAERFEAFAAKDRREAVRAAFGGGGRMKVVATYSIKGGVGKTSAAVNLAALAAGDGLRTVVWDLDPQGAATYLFRIKPKVKGGGRRLIRERDPLAVMKGTDIEGLDLLPADFSYRNLDLELDRRKHPLEGLTPRARPARGRLRPGDPRLPAVDLAALGERVHRRRPAAGAAVPSTLSVRTLEQLRAFLADGPTAAARRARVLLDGRPPQAPAQRAGGVAARRAARRLRRRDPRRPASSS